MVQPRGRSSPAVLQGCESLLKISKQNLIVDALAKVLSPRSAPKVIQRSSYPAFSKTRRSERRAPVSDRTKMLIRVHTMSCVMCRAQDMPSTRFKLSMDGEITEVAAERQRVRRRHAWLQERS